MPFNETLHRQALRDMEDVADAKEAAAAWVRDMRAVEYGRAKRTSLWSWPCKFDERYCPHKSACPAPW